MKKAIKLLSLSILTLSFLISCKSDDLKFQPAEEIGWIQFVEPTSSIELSQDLPSQVISLGVNIQVPTTSSDLTINYNLVSVSGLDPNTAFSNSGSIISPAGETGYSGPDNSTGIDYVYLPTINLDSAEVPALTEPMVFDVVLTGTSSSNITAGLAGETFPITQRVSICPSVDSSTGLFIGDYILTVPTGAGPFGQPFTDGQTITLAEGVNGSLSREFMSVYLPGFQADLMTISFSFVNGNIVIDNGLNTDIGCASFILLDGDSGNILPSPCGDTTIELNVIDFAGGSGGCGQADIPMTILLTKV